jgi:diguanylate cyclase (GGDEF)-like protein
MPEPSARPLQQPLNSLATRIIAVVFLATFLTALVVSWISVHSTYAFLRRQVDRSYPALLGAAAQRTMVWLAEGHAALETLAREDGLRAALSSLSDPRAAAERLEATLGADSFFETLILADAFGTVRVAPGADLERWSRGLVPPEAEGIFPLALDEGHIVPAVSVRVLDSSGAISGHLHGIFRGDVLRRKLLDLGLGSNVQIYALDEHGRPRWTRAGATLPRAGPFPEPDTGTTIYRNASGHFVVGTAHAIGSWRLVLEQPFQDAFEPVFSVVTRVFVIDLCIILLFSFLAYQITAAVVRPIEALSEGARRISQGRLGIEIPEPPSQDEVGLLTRTFNDMTRKLMRTQGEIHDANAKLKAQNEELQRANEVLEQLSITDGLTKLHNHRFFQDYLTREIKRVSRTEEPLSMLLIDIDDFKRLNDRLGHAAGDELLVRIARILNDSIRESDLVARYGGEEFVVLAPDTDLAGAVSLAEKVRTSIAESSFILDDSKQLTKMTISVGVAQYEGNRKTFFHAADQALYRAKASGKNCVVADDGHGEAAPAQSA